MTMTITLPDDQAAALQAKAAAAGLSLEDWLRKLSETEKVPSAATPLPSGTGTLKLAADIVLGHMRDVPPEDWEGSPKDGASQHDHYLYGWPKREV